MICTQFTYDIYKTDLSSFSFVATAFVVDEMTVALHCDASMLFWQGLRTHKTKDLVSYIFGTIHFQGTKITLNF